MREPQVLACCIGPLNQLAPGCVSIALATGFSAAGTMGCKPMRWARVVADVRIARALVAGKKVEAEYEGRARLIRHLHRGVGTFPIIGLLGAGIRDEGEPIDSERRV